MKRLSCLFFLWMGLFFGASIANARQVIPLMEGWRFSSETDLGVEYARPVVLPHSWGMDDFLSRVSSSSRGIYQQIRFIPSEWAGKRLFLKFHGVENTATLFLNGAFIGTHRGAGVAFTFEITGQVLFGQDNLLRVVVDKNRCMDLLPQASDLNLYGGLTRGVELLVTEKTAVSPLYLGTDGVLVHQTSASEEKAEGEVEVHVTSGQAGSCELALSIYAEEGEPLFERRQRIKLDGRKILLPYEIENPQLWSPTSPTMHRVEVKLLNGNRVLDEVEVKTGFRQVEVTAEGGLKINAQRVKIHGVTLHHDNQEHSSALTSSDLQHDMKMIQQMGANAVRSALMPHPALFYDLCDQKGILSWVDFPLHHTFLGDVSFIPSREFEQSALLLLQEIIAQNLNHPSVVMWGLFSKMTLRGDSPLSLIQKLNLTAHAMDASRPTVALSDQDGEINFITDLIVWRQGVGWDRGSTEDIKVWKEQLQRNWSHLRSGVAYGGEGMLGHGTSQPLPIRLIPQSRQRQFHEGYQFQLSTDSLFWGVWVNNLFDFGSSRHPYGENSQGLVARNHHTCKDAYYLYRTLWNPEQPTLHLCDKDVQLREAAPVRFTIYSSVGLPELRLNGLDYPLKEWMPGVYRSEELALQGKIEVSVRAYGLEDAATLYVGMLSKPQPLLAPLQTVNPQTTN